MRPSPSPSLPSLWSTAFIVALVLPASVALAAPGGAAPLFETLATDRRSERIDGHDALMQTFYGVFRPDLLAPRYASLDRSDAPSCATALLAELTASWEELSGTERHVVDYATSPIYRDWVDRGGMTWEEGDVAALQAEERGPCFGPTTALPSGGPYSETTETEHFVIYYNEGGDVTDSLVQSLAGWFEESFTVEHEEMGFYRPSNMGSYQMLVMVEQLPSPYTGGFTSYTQCLNDYMAFVVVNSQWFDSTDSLKSVAAHEFFHGIQIEYAMAEMWANSETINRWWIEASAVFMESEVYPTLYGSQLSQAARWYSAPWRSLTTYDSTGFQYGTYLFAASIRQSLDDSSWFQDLWDQIEGRANYDLMEEIDELLAERGASVEEEFGRFLERGATGDFDFNPWMQLEDGFIEVELSAEHDEDDLPLSETINSSADVERPEYRGANYVWIDGQGVDDDMGLIVRFDGSGIRSGTELTWEVRLVAVEDEEPELTWDMVLEPIEDSDGELASWEGSVLLNDFGEDFDGVYLIASPTTRFGDSGATWSYSAELTYSRADGSFMEVPDDALPGDEDEGAGCGCSSQPGGQSGGGQALALSALIGLLYGQRRRRETAARRSEGYTPG